MLSLTYLYNPWQGKTPLGVAGRGYLSGPHRQYSHRDIRAECVPVWWWRIRGDFLWGCAKRGGKICPCQSSAKGGGQGVCAADLRGCVSQAGTRWRAPDFWIGGFRALWGQTDWKGACRYFCRRVPAAVSVGLKFVFLHTALWYLSRYHRVGLPIVCN